MKIRHPYYRLNPSRSIQINGTIDRDLLSRVTPHVLKLQAQARDPITVYIDSNGGAVSVMETLLNVLRLSDQDSSDPCHIITAVTTKAASAAADLLSSGDYAVAFPHSLVTYHGMRTEERGALTAETSSWLAGYLRRRNDQYALELARKIDDRFSFRFVFAYDEFEEIRKQRGSPTLPDIDCFIEFIDGKLSPEAKKVWKRAKERHARYRQLFDTVMRKAGKIGSSPTVAQTEAIAIKAIADFEVRANKVDSAWSFRGGGMERLMEDFALFNEYMANFGPFGSDRLQRWSSAWGRIAVRPDRLKEIEAIQDEEQKKQTLEGEIRSILHPLTSFFAALCHALQEGENYLTAEDAYWLGLVDEVVGRDDLLCLRHFEESQEDEDGKEDSKPSE